MSKDFKNEIKKIKEAAEKYKKDSNKADPNITLVIAISDSDVDAVNNAIAQGADVSHIDKYGYTPLIYAAVFNQTGQITSILLSKGADPFYRTAGGLAALDFAEFEKHYETVSVLKKAMNIPEDNKTNLSDETFKA